MKPIDDPPLYVTLPAVLELPLPTAPREERPRPIVTSAAILRRPLRRR